MKKIILIMLILISSCYVYAENVEPEVYCFQIETINDTSVCFSTSDLEIPLICKTFVDMDYEYEIYDNYNTKSYSELELNGNVICFTDPDPTIISVPVIADNIPEIVMASGEGNILFSRQFADHIKLGENIIITVTITNNDIEAISVSLQEFLPDSVEPIDPLEPEIIAWEGLKKPYYQFNIDVPAGSSKTVSYQYKPLFVGDYIITSSNLMIGTTKILIDSDTFYVDCNENAICEPVTGENFKSCPVDCKEGAEDLICDSSEDGFCDPDCKRESDLDCLTEKEITTLDEKPALFGEVIIDEDVDITNTEEISQIIEKANKPKNNVTIGIIILINVILIIGVAIGVYLYFRKKNITPPQI